MSMLKTTILSQIFISNKVLSAKVFATNKVDDIESGGRSKYVKPKTRRSESQKLSKSKKLSKTENSPKFNTKKNGPSFLTLGARKVFNHLWLAFNKALILQHFDPKYHI